MLGKLNFPNCSISEAMRNEVALLTSTEQLPALLVLSTRSAIDGSISAYHLCLECQVFRSARSRDIRKVDIYYMPSC